MGKKWPTAVDLFSGCGAVTEGLKKRHFNVFAAVENDPVAAKTYRLNHRTVSLYEKDIREFDPEVIIKNELKDESLDLLVVCAPCQPFSSQNGYNGDSRTNLIFESIKFIQKLNPKVVLFENVKGLKTGKFTGLLEQLREEIHECDYKLQAPQEVNAADYGVPQRRLRCIMFSVRSDISKFPETPPKKTPEDQRKTVGDFIKDLPKLKSGESSEEDPLHVARRHHSITLERIKHVPPGGNRLNIPEELELECHKKYEGHLDVLGRMAWDELAPTLTTGCTDVYKGQFTHPENDRAITLREAALLQTFPKDYEFYGNSSEIGRQIGNAVPVKLIEEVIPEVRKVL